MRHKFFFFIAVLMFLLFARMGLDLESKNAQYLQREQELQKMLEEEQKRTAKIDAYEDYLNSDEFVEDIAREKLGMAYDDEIIFNI